MRMNQALGRDTNGQENEETSILASLGGNRQ